MNDELIGLRIIGAIMAAISIAWATKMLVHPTPRLAGRVRPYTATSRSVLGRLPEHTVITGQEATGESNNVFTRLSRPLIEALTARITKILGAAFDDERLSLKLRQAGILPQIADSDRAQEFRIRQVGAAVGFGLGSAFAGVLVGLPPAAVVALFIAGAVIGVARRSAGVSKQIDEKRERMLVELYTINQLLAIYLRTSGSPIMATQRLVRRGRGAVIDELNEALRFHARGMSATKAFDRIGDTTPEPFAARTYKLLASGSERGADLAAALLSLSDDIRDHRRTEVRRMATKRQGAVLLPIILLLAPVMLLFIAAPLPTMIFGNLR